MVRYSNRAFFKLKRLTSLRCCFPITFPRPSHSRPRPRATNRLIANDRLKRKNIHRRDRVSQCQGLCSWRHELPLRSGIFFQRRTRLHQQRHELGIFTIRYQRRRQWSFRAEARCLYQHRPGSRHALLCCVDVKNKLHRDIAFTLFRAHIMIPLPDLAFYLGRLFCIYYLLTIYFLALRCCSPEWMLVHGLEIHSLVELGSCAASGRECWLVGWMDGWLNDYGLITNDGYVMTCLEYDVHHIKGWVGHMPGRQTTSDI